MPDSLGIQWERDTEFPAGPQPQRLILIVISVGIDIQPINIEIAENSAKTGHTYRSYPSTVTRTRIVLKQNPLLVFYPGPSVPSPIPPDMSTKFCLLARYSDLFFNSPAAILAGAAWF